MHVIYFLILKDFSTKQILNWSFYFPETSDFSKIANVTITKAHSGKRQDMVSVYFINWSFAQSFMKI